MTSPLRSVDVEAFRRDGWLVIPSALDKPQLGALDAAVGRLEKWAGNDGPGLHHFEQTDAGAVLARSEDFVPHDETLRAFVCRGLVVEVLAALFGEPAVLFKEKINYKYPGGGGFAPHQDASAYRFVDHHISCMVPLDHATPASGCLYVAPGFEAGQLPTDQRGRIEESTAAQLDWRPMPLEPGDLLFFDSYTPHYSDTNTTDRPRRAAYLTYNAASLGDHRRRYYDDKQEEFSRAGGDFAGERVRISISDDFLGRPVSGDTHALDPLDPLLAAYRSPIANQMYDETVTELEHALQTAALARVEGATPELIAASLLHDVGHLVVDDVTPNGADRLEDRRHEAAGENFLSQWFGPEVTSPVARHVAAKRYLCAVDAGYLSELSPASVRSLHLQGGPMTQAEIAEFERDVHHRAAVQLRRWDDRAKVQGLEVPAFGEYQDLLRSLTTGRDRQ